jgi:hypothetical protein
MKPIYTFDVEKGCSVIDYGSKKYLIDYDDYNKIINSRKRFTFEKDDDLYPSYQYNEQRINYLVFLYKYKETEKVEYVFSNGNSNDLRKKNVTCYHAYHKIIVSKYNVKKYIPGHLSTTNIMKNPIWLIQGDDEKEYMIMYCEKDTECKICIEGYRKIVEYENMYNEGKKITWYKIQSNYIMCSLNLYMHQIITGIYGNGNDIQVLHNDKNLLNNSIINLRVETKEMKYQNRKYEIKRGERKEGSQELPQGITYDMMAKYVVYYNEWIYPEKVKKREYFKIESHPKLEKPWIGSKSSLISIQTKLKKANEIVELLEKGIDIETCNKISKNEKVMEEDELKKQSENDEVLKIEEDNQMFLDIFKNVPPHPSYIAGFIDGDGNIFIRKIMDGYQSGIVISQSRTNILQVLRYHFGGSITTSENRNNNENIIDKNGYYDKKTIRNEYNLIIRSNEYSKLLEFLRDTFVVKHEQYECLYSINKISNLPGFGNERNVYFQRCHTLNKKQEIVELKIDRINIHYIQGLFDAEGCVYIDKDLNKKNIRISQKNNPLLLDQIALFFGFGKKNKENECYIITSSNDILEFIKKIKNGCIVKYNQLCAMEIFLNTNDPIVKKKMYKICNREKHEVESISEDKLNQKNIGKNAYIEFLQIKERMYHVFIEIRKIKQYKEKSENMMGELNHNYGKEKTEEIKKKMSFTHKIKKGIPDEIILKVREMLKNGYKGVDIEKELNVGRHVVSRIKTGTLVCLNEEKTHTCKTLEERSINKRKLDLHEILFVLDKLFENENQTKILKLLKEKRISDSLDTNEITIDMIKNIKRKILKNELPLYPFEEHYHEYMEKLKKINTS